MPLTNCEGISCAVVLFTIGFASITLPIYVLLLLHLTLKRRQYGSSFYKIFLSTGIADILITIHKLSTTEIPQIFFYKEVLFNAPMANFTNIGIWYLYFAQIIGTILLALNRYSAVAFPINYEQIWSNKVLLLAFATQWILPVVTIVPMIHPCCKSIYANVSLEAVFIDKKVDYIYYIADVVIECLIFLPIIVIVYLLLFIKLSRRPKLSQNQAKKLRMEIKLAIVGIFTSCCFAAMNIIVILGLIEGTSKRGSVVLNLLWYLTSDMFTLSCPYLLLGCSREVRRSFFKFLSCGVI